MMQRHRPNLGFNLNNLLFCVFSGAHYKDHSGSQHNVVARGPYNGVSVRDGRVHVICEENEVLSASGDSISQFLLLGSSRRIIDHSAVDDTESVLC